jgi:hypothetical protein
VFVEDAGTQPAGQIGHMKFSSYSDRMRARCARPDHAGRPQAGTPFAEGATLVLYTDGLIERRTEDTDTGLARLADSLARHRQADPETLADALLTDLLPPAGVADDTALVVLRL